MRRIIFRSATLLIICAFSAPSVHAEGWTDTGTAGAAQGADTGNTTYKTGSPEAFNEGHGYTLENPGRSAFGGWNSQGTSARTGQNKVNLPATVTAMPIIKDGVNTGLTGGSLALRTQYNSDGSPALMEIPKTVVNSFVWQAQKVGTADAIFNDEGAKASTFKPIEAGINSPALTTGHKSDAPPASGF
jgi:hypothetical protein